MMPCGKKIVIIGGGGHAASILELGLRVDGYVDSSRRKGLSAEWIGDDERFAALFPPEQGNVAVHIAVVSGPDCRMDMRRGIIERYAAYPAATLIAPTAVVTGNAHIGDGSAIMHGAIVNGANLDRHVVINTGAVVEHGCRIGENVFIGPNSTVCGGVTIGSDCYIGAGAVVRNNVSICNGVTIGAGSVVVCDISDVGAYVGVPARKLK